MAIEDSGSEGKGLKLELVSRTTRTSPTPGVNIGKRIDVEKVDVFVDLASLGVGLVTLTCRLGEKNVVNLNSGSAVSDLTGSQCSPNTVHWVYDTYMLANGTGKALVKSGGEHLALLNADYAGHAGTRYVGCRHHANGGKSGRRQASAQQRRLLLLPAGAVLSA